MKIKHTLKIQEDGVTISGKITDVIWEDNARGDYKWNYSKDNGFKIRSSNTPALYFNELHVFGEDTDEDSNLISNHYSCEEEAQKIMDYINEFTVPEKVLPKIKMEADELWTYFERTLNSAREIGLGCNKEELKEFIRDIADILQ